MIGSGEASPIGPAGPDDIAGVVELFKAFPPTHWMKAASHDDLRAFLRYALESPRAVLLVARPPAEQEPTGYVFAILDARRFWLEFALRNPALAQGIFVRQLKRKLERQRASAPGAQGDGAQSLPPFAWSASDPGAARIVGLFVRPDNAGKGVTMDLYFKLCETLQAKGVAKVEEYMNPAFFPPPVRAFFELCGWDIQECRCRGYKLSKTL